MRKSDENHLCKTNRKLQFNLLFFFILWQKIVTHFWLTLGEYSDFKEAIFKAYFSALLCNYLSLLIPFEKTDVFFLFVFCWCCVICVDGLLTRSRVRQKWNRSFFCSWQNGGWCLAPWSLSHRRQHFCFCCGVRAEAEHTPWKLGVRIEIGETVAITFCSSTKTVSTVCTNTC